MKEKKKLEAREKKRGKIENAVLLKEKASMLRAKKKPGKANWQERPVNGGTTQGRDQKKTGPSGGERDQITDPDGRR